MSLTLKKGRAVPKPDGVPAEPPMKKDFLSILDWEPRTIERCLDLAQSLKRDRGRRRRGSTNARPLDGQHVALLFEKPSLRTRSTFEIAIRELGGFVLEPRHETTFGGRESYQDVARNLERWVSGVVMRTFAQRRLEDFAAAAPRLSVVNALTDEEHPCQALADLLTLTQRWGSGKGRTVAFIGDGNNVATSLCQACLMMGISVHLASPEGYELSADVLTAARDRARFGADARLFRDPVEAVRGVDAVYTDTWTSMGEEAEEADRLVRFAAYQVNAALMAHASDEACFMHCLPAHRGEEVTDEVIDSAASVVFDQAENRLHAQKALLAMLMGGA